MNEDEHIIGFKFNYSFFNRLISNNDIFINDYSSSKDKRYVIFIDIYYNNLNIYSSIPAIYKFDYIFNLSNMLYKLHTKDYYCKYNHNCKELI